MYRPDDGGRLTPLTELDDFVKELRPGPWANTLLSVIAPPSSPYSVTVTAGDTRAPALAPSCRGLMGETGTPVPRLRDAADRRMAWSEGILTSVCDDSFVDALVPLFTSYERGSMCVPPTTALRLDGTPDCHVVARKFIAATDEVVDRPLPYCDAHHANYPCWTVASGTLACGGINALQVCDEPLCLRSVPWSREPGYEELLVTCALDAPCGGGR